MTGRFTPETARAANAKSHAKPRYRPLTQGRILTVTLYQASQLLWKDMQSEPDSRRRALMGGSIAQLVRGWETVQDMVRELSGVPRVKPAAAKPAAAKPKAKPKAKPLSLPALPSLPQEEKSILLPPASPPDPEP